MKRLIINDMYSWSVFSEYPDSKKVLPFAVREIYRKGESLNYFDGEGEDNN